MFSESLSESIFLKEYMDELKIAQYKDGMKELSEKTETELQGKGQNLVLFFRKDNRAIQFLYSKELYFNENERILERHISDVYDDGRIINDIDSGFINKKEATLEEEIEFINQTIGKFSL